MIAIINYGFGNTGSIQNMIRKLGYESVITNDPAVLRTADKLILPGVGSFDHGIRALRDAGLEPVLNELVKVEKKPILGICLGMQLMTESSEEGVLPGLGWIKGKTVKFIPSQEQERIPHMGWNEVSVGSPSKLCKGFDETYRYYFVHSYYIKCDNEADTILYADYIQRFTAAFQSGNIYGVQFHPEKSHRFGMQILRNFIEEV